MKKKLSYSQKAPEMERYFYQRHRINSTKEGIALKPPNSDELIPIVSFIETGDIDLGGVKQSEIVRAGDAEADDTTGLDWMELSAEPVREILVNAGFIGEMGGDGTGNMNMETVVDQLRLQILTQVMGNVTETVIDQTGYVELRPGKVEKLKRINRDIYIEKIQEKLGAIKTYELESYGETLMRSFNNDPLNLETQIRLDAVRRELDKRIVVTGAQEDQDYPSPLLDSFEDSLFNIEEFTVGLKPSRELPSEVYEAMSTRCDGVKFRIQPHQVFLREQLAPGTPYRSILVFHGTGAMKTCSGIQIAEAWLEKQDNPNKKAFILAPVEVQSGFAREIWKPTENPSAKCTGDLYDRLRDETGRKIPNIINDRQQIMGYVQFANQLKRVLGERNRDLGDEERRQLVRKYREYIHQRFDNALLIIDEAHNIRSGSEGKQVPPFLEDVVRIANNLTLVLMTATPMQNDAEEIVDILNLLRLNDRRGPILLREIFKSDGTLQEDYAGKLERYARGQISQQRGSNPLVFSSVLMMGERERPAITAFGNEQDERVNLERVGVEIGEASVQGRKLVELAGELEDEKSMRSFVQSKVFSQASDIVYPGGEIGDDGFDACFSKMAGGNKNRYRYKDSVLEKQGRFMREDGGLAQQAAKFVEVLRGARECNGVILVFTQYLKACAIPLAIAMEELGFEAYGGAENNLLVLEDDAGTVRDVMDARPGRPSLGEVRGTEAEGDFIPARQALLTGSDIGAANREIIEAARGPENADGSVVKVLIGTRVIMEGVDFQNLREIHVMDPWFNLSLLKQVIGRGSRFCSHKALPVRMGEDGVIESERNCEVQIQAGRVGGRAFSDDIILDSAEEKANVIVDVTKLLKGSAVDCNLFHEVNSYPREQQDGLLIRQVTGRGDKVEATFGDVPGSLECDFMEGCDQACINSVDIGEREERVGELRQYSVGRGIVGGDLAIREYLGREFYGSPVQSLEHIVVNLMKILRTTRRRVMEEILSYVRTKRTFVVPPSEDGFPGVLTIRKFADGRPDTLVFQGMNVETGEYVDPHDMQENRDVNKVVKANIYGRMTPPSVTAPKVAAAAAGGATVLDVGGDGGDFGILDKVWNALGEGIDEWTSVGTFGEMFVDMGEVYIHPETQDSVGIVPVITRKKDAKKVTLGKDELKSRKELGALFETFFVISVVGRILGIPISILRRAALLRQGEFGTFEQRWEFLKNRLSEGGEELGIMRELGSGARLIGIPTDNKGNIEYLVYRDGDGLIDKVNRNDMKKRVFAEAMSEWKTEQNTRARKLERSGLNYEFGFENLRGFKAEKREEFNLIDQTRQRGRGRACNLTDIDVLQKYAGDMGLTGNRELVEFISRYAVDVKGKENLGKRKQVMCVALELVMRHQDMEGRARGEPRMFFTLDEDIVLKKALGILSGKA